MRLIKEDRGGFCRGCDVARGIHTIVDFRVARDNEFGFIDFHGGSEAR